MTIKKQTNAPLSARKLEDVVVELQKENALLRKLAYKDPLTGVYNRRGFMEELRRVFGARSHGGERRAKFHIETASLVFLDVDRFKRANDTYGHEAGDAILKRVGATLRAAVRDSDLVGRWGGEEFVVALVGANERDAARIAEKLRERIAGTIVRSGGKRIPVTASMGVAEMRNGDDVKKFVKRADEAMYAAKKGGRNRVIAWNALGKGE